MEAPHSGSRSPSTDDSLTDSPTSTHDRPKSTPPDPATSDNFPQLQGPGDSSSAQVQAPAGSSNLSEGKCHHHVDDDVAMVLRRKLNDYGLGDTTPVPPETLHPNEDTDSQEGFSEDEYDLCSSSSSDDNNNTEEFQGHGINAGVVRPVLPDIQLRVPMEDANDVRRVKDALLIKGVLDVVCDVQTQTVTITGTVPPLRLLEKARQLKPRARIISTLSPFSAFLNPNYFRSSAFPHIHDEDSNSIPPIDIPSPRPGMIPSFVVHRQRPRPTFQRYNFHNDPHSPYLRTFSPTNLSPENSPSRTTGNAFDHHRRVDSEFIDDDGPFIY